MSMSEEIKDSRITDALANRRLVIIVGRATIAAKLALFDAIAFGCPAMGAEELEETEFAPMFDAVKGSLSGKDAALFGSYGWGDGEWMRTWEDDCRANGMKLVCDSVICCEAPDDEAVENCRKLGAELAK